MVASAARTPVAGAPRALGPPRQAGRETPSGQKRLRREALPVAEARGPLRPVLVGAGRPANMRQDWAAFLRGHSAALRSPLRKQPSLGAPVKLVQDPDSGLHGLPSQVPLLPWNWPSYRSVPAAGTQKNWHRAIATVPERWGRRAAMSGASNGTRPGKIVAVTQSLAPLWGWHGGMLPGRSPNTFCG